MQSAEQFLHLERRFRHMELELKRLKQFTVVALGIVVAGGLGPLIAYLALSNAGVTESRLTPGSGALNARQVVVTDDRGRPRIDLRADGATPGVTLYDAEGVARARLSERGLESIDAEGRVRGRFGDLGAGVGMALGALPERHDLSVAATGAGPEITLSDPAGRPRVHLGLLAGEPNATLFDDQGRERLGFAVSRAGAHLRMSDAQARVRALLRSGDAGGAALELFDAGGARRASMRMGPDDQAKIEVVED